MSKPHIITTELRALSYNQSHDSASRPLPNFTRIDETKLAQIQKVETIAPVPNAITVDGVGEEIASQQPA